MGAAVIRNIQNITVPEIQKGVVIRMDAQYLKNREGVGFPVIKNPEGKSLLVFTRRRNTPLIEGARYDVVVKRVTVSPKKTKTGGYQLVFAQIEILRIVEYMNRFYSPEKSAVIEQRRSGRVIIGKEREITVQKTEVFYKNSKENASVIYTADEYIDDGGAVIKRDILKGETRRCWRRNWNKTHHDGTEETVLELMPLCPEPI